MDTPVQPIRPVQNNPPIQNIYTLEEPYP